MDARAMFQQEYGGAKNFMTPHGISMGKRGPLAYEISSGPGIMPDTTLYGVTVLRENPDGSITREHDLSDMFYTLNDAQEYTYTL